MVECTPENERCCLLATPTRSNHALPNPFTIRFPLSTFDCGLSTFSRKSFNIHTYKTCVCNSFIFHTYETSSLKSFRIHTYKKRGGGATEFRVSANRFSASLARVTSHESRV